MGPDNHDGHRPGCNDEVHKAYEKLQQAIENFMQVKERNNRLVMTDFFVYGSFTDLLDNTAGYSWVASNSAPHVLEGLLVMAGRDLIDDEIERRF